jgi:hypothetical protein
VESQLSPPHPAKVLETLNILPSPQGFEEGFVASVPVLVRKGASCPSNLTKLCPLFPSLYHIISGEGKKNPSASLSFRG